MQRKDVNTARDALDVRAGHDAPGAGLRPGLCARAADGVNSAAAWVNVLSIYAHVNLPARGMWSASKAAALSLRPSACARDARRRRARAERVSRSAGP